MANRRREPVSYRPFRTQPLLADGLLPVVRPGGELESAAGDAFFQLARRFKEENDLRAAHDGELAGELAGLAGAPKIGLEGETTGSQSADGEPAAWRNAIASIESAGSGDYKAVGPRHKKMGRALGRYQIMEANIGPWSREALGRKVSPAEFMTTPAIQDAIFDRKFGSYVKQFGPEGAAQAWFAGPDGVGKTGRKDALGTNVGSYGQKFLAALGKAPTGSTPAAAPSMSITGGGARPTGRNTAFDRAYDKAFTRTYLDKTDAEIRRITGEVAERYKDDPATLQKAFGALKKELARDHIYPEIMAEFDVGFDRLTAGYMDQAQKRAQDRQADADRAQFRTETDALVTEQARKIAGFDPKDGVAADMIAADQAAIDAHFDQAAARGVIDAEDAQKAKSSFRRESALRFYEKQADTGTADEVAAMRKDMAKDFADGGLAGLDGEAWTDLDRRLAAMETQKRGQANAAANKLRARGDDMAGRLLQGVEVNQGELTQLMLDSGNSAEGKAQLAETMAKISAGRAIRDLPLAEGRAYVEGLRKQYGDAPSDSDARKLGFAEKAYLAKKKAIQDDPLTYAAQQSGQTLQPIDDTDASTLAQSMAERRSQAINAARELGAPVSMFLPEEVKAMKAAVKTTDPQAFSQTMARFDEVAQMGGVEDVRRQFGDDAADAVQDWQGRLRYSSKEELAVWLKERADPKWAERKKPLLNQGEKEARKVEFADLVQEFDDSFWTNPGAPVDGDTRRMFMNDFVQLAGERFATSQDAATARQQAVERMKGIWGVTSAFGERGGRLMAYPPERFYPTIGGSQDWIGDQLAAVAKERNVAPEQVALVADMKTKSAADRGQMPGYLLSVVDPETGLDELAVDERGSPLRVYFDTAKAAREASGRARATEDAKYDPWLVIGQDTFIGPFFPPWNPPTDREMKRVRERAAHIANDVAGRNARRADVWQQGVMQDQP